VDLDKLKKFRIIDTWYANSPLFDKATMREELKEEIFRAIRQILSFERVPRPGIGKEKLEILHLHLLRGDRSRLSCRKGALRGLWFHETL
jgi:hypothetical protein